MGVVAISLFAGGFLKDDSGAVTTDAARWISTFPATLAVAWATGLAVHRFIH